MFFRGRVCISLITDFFGVLLFFDTLHSFWEKNFPGMLIFIDTVSSAAHSIGKLNFDTYTCTVKALLY